MSKATLGSGKRFAAAEKAAKAGGAKSAKVVSKTGKMAAAGRKRAAKTKGC